jgi:hypothetical protein
MSAFAFRTDYLLAVDFQTDDPIKEAASRLKLIHMLYAWSFFKNIVSGTKPP